MPGPKERFSFRFWTEREEEILRKLWHIPEVSIRDICEVLGRSADSVQHKAKRMNFPAKGLIQEKRIDEELLQKLLKVVEA